MFESNGSINNLPSHLEFYDSCIRSFIGANKSVKFVDDCGDVQIIGCVAEYLHELESEHPVHQLVESSIKSFHECFGCGSTTYLAMFYYWHRAFRKLAIENWNLSDVIKELDACLEVAIQSLKSITTSLQNEYEGEPESNLIKGLSRYEEPFATFMKKIWHDQALAFKEHGQLDFRLDLSLISSTTCTAATSGSRVVSGIVVKANDEAVDLIFKREAASKWRTLLINGSLTHKFAHKGINLALKTARETNNISSLAKSDINEWAMVASNTIKQLQVDCVLVSGKADQNLALFLYSKGVLVLSHVGARVVENVARHTGAKVATYVADCDQLNVAHGLTLSADCVDVVSGQAKADLRKVLVLISSPDINFQTVVICHPISSYSLHLEHRFWHVAHRLNNVCRSGKFLPGGGVTEHYVTATLLQASPHPSALFQVCNDAVSEAFRCYVEAVDQSNQRGDCDQRDVTTYDDYTGKVEGWQSAFRLACLLLRTDAVLVSGDTDGQASVRSAVTTARGADHTVLLGYL